MSLLSGKIDQHLAQGFTAFHSPAHAGKLNARDLTELDGLDDLQYPQTVLKESQEFVAELFAAKRSFFLVNGASVGMQAACIALKIYLNTINDKRPVLVARNVHKSVIAGIILAGLDMEWLEPEWNEELGVYTRVFRHCEERSDEAISKSMRSPRRGFAAPRDDVSALIITNPTYEGFYSQIPKLDIPVIVDEAHGAHYQFSKQLPEPALAYGADIAVQSWHKTLGSLGQTGVLHVSKTSKIPEKYLADALRLLQTTSPSYLLLESLCNVAKLYAEQGTEIVERTMKLSQSLGLPRYANDDPYRLIIPGAGYEIEYLLRENKILIEAAYENFALLFINPGNSQEDVGRLSTLALDIQNVIARSEATKQSQPVIEQSNTNLREAFLNGDTEIYAPCPPGIVVSLTTQNTPKMA